MTPTTHKPASPIYAARDFLNRYMVFPSPDYPLVCALYAAATHLWTQFDAFPYLHLTASVKRAGKTRLSELLAFMCANPINVAGASAASIFRRIEDDKPTLFMDEIESLASEAASIMRTVLNVGYRRGQTVSRMGKNGVVDYETYCPKVFIGIGDLYDTLRDRTIVIRLTRGTPAERFVYAIASTDGEQLRDQLIEAVKEKQNEILNSYMTNGELSFLSDRDAELWTPLFAVCHGIAPELVDELKRIAVDMSTEKTAVARKHMDLKESEAEAQEKEYSEHLVRDMAALVKGKKYVTSADAIELLKAIPTAPWRKFRGDGLTMSDMARLLNVHHVRPRYIKISKTANKVARGYRKDDLEKAASAL